MRVLLAAVLAAVALAGCGHKQKITPAPVPVERPIISLTGAKVEKLDFGGLQLSFGCAIDNPNPFHLAVARVRYALALEGRNAAAGTIATPLEIAPAAPEGAGRGAIVVPVTVRFSDVPAFASLIQGDREAEYALGGEVVFETPAGPVAVPIAQAGRVAMPRAPRFHAGKVQLRSASPREVVLEVPLDVTNPNAFALPAGRISYALLMSNKEVAKAEVVVHEPIAGGGSAALAMPIKISMLKAGKAAARLMLPFASLDVGVRGQAEFGGVPVPLDLGTSIVKD
jgi:LEA14-like dessication related protein